MAELAVSTGTRQSEWSSFFFWMAVLATALVVIGFGITYLVPLAAGGLRPVAPMVHVHAAFYFGWMLLLILQSALVGRGNVSLHRSLGLFGISVATGMLLIGLAMTLIITRAQLEEGFEGAYDLAYISFVALAVFGSLFVLAIRARADREAHRRYMLLATIALIGAGINRIYDALFGWNFNYLAIYLTMDAMIALLLVYDWRTLSHLHRATVVGAAANIVPQLLHVPVAGSAGFHSAVDWLAGLAVYNVGP